jgi:putative iron-regulated protein
MKVALEAQSPEDEHDCFSDNTHFSHFYNAQGVSNVYLGQYTRLDGSQVKAVGLTHLVEKKNAELDSSMKAALENTKSKLQVMVDAAEAEKPMKFDQMIAPGNAMGEAIVLNSIQALVAQTEIIAKVAGGLGIQNLNPDTADHSF